MYERFTDRARKVMQLANQEAQRFNHEYIGTEHILLGLVKEGSGVAANVLKNLDVDLRKIRLEVERIVQPGAGPRVLGDDGGFWLRLRNLLRLGPRWSQYPLTPRAVMAVRQAIDEAWALGHAHVGTEHLLLGLVRETEGVAGVVLANLGVRPDDVRGGVLTILG